MRLKLAARLRAFGADRRGSIALIFGLSAMVLIGLTGGGTDYARLTARRNQLRSAVDAGALAGGNALKLAMPNADAIIGLTTQTIRTEAHAPDDRPLTIQVTVSDDKTSVLATAEEQFSLAFGAYVGLPKATIAVRARANVVGQMRLCMLTLDSGAPAAFALQ